MKAKRDACVCADTSHHGEFFSFILQVACLPYTLPQEVAAAKYNYNRASSNLQPSDAEEQPTYEAADTQLGGRTRTSEDVLVVNAGVHHNVPEVRHTISIARSEFALNVP